MSKNCGRCRWLKEYHTSPNDSVKNYECTLSKCIFSTNQALDCPWYDKDLDDEMICFNCKHFLGGSDWGLACEKHYNRLPQFDSSVCDKFERRNNKR